MEELVIDISKQFATVAIAVWILVAALYKLPINEAKFPKELMALCIGIVVTIIGYFTNFFTGNLIALISTMVIAVFVAQLTYDKIKVIFTQIKKG